MSAGPRAESDASPAGGDDRRADPRGDAGGSGPRVPPKPAGEPSEPVPSTRVGSAWLALAPGLALLVAVVVFIVENRQVVQVGFFGAHWALPLGIDLLLAAVVGGLIVFLLGSLRIYQLRRVARRHHTARLRAEQHPGTGPPG